MIVLYGELAQLGEHLPCTQGVKGSNPLFSTINDSWSDIKICEKYCEHIENWIDFV